MVFNVDFNKCTGCSSNIGRFLSICMNEDKNDLFQYLKEHGVLSDRVLCRQCLKPVKANFKKRGFYCSKLQTINNRKKKCTYKETFLNGTIFSRSNLSIHQISQFMVHWMSRDPPRQEFISNELNMGSQSIIHWSNLCRNVTIYWAQKNCSMKIGGIGKIVEIDVVKFGQKKSLQNVFGGIERESQNVFLVPVSNVDSDTLLLNIKDKILPGTTVISCLKSLECLANEGYHHLQVKKSVHSLDPDSEVHIQNVEQMWREVYSKLPQYGRKLENFEGYLSEYLFKRACPNHTLRLHNFFKTLGELYTPEYVDRCIIGTKCIKKCDVDVSKYS